MGAPFKEIKMEGRRHFLVGGEIVVNPRCKYLVAHYDRVEGTPGANDNSASVHHLLDFSRSLLKRSGPLKNAPEWPGNLRIVFTDGEELGPALGPQEQGAFALGKFLTTLGARDGFFVVFDMTGIGDAFVLGRAGEQLLAHRSELLAAHKDLARRFVFNRLHARRLLSATGSGQYFEVNTPFSDDMGLLMAGIPAIQISLLPHKEALQYKKNAPRTGEEIRPPSWQSMHTDQDRPERLSQSAFPLMRELLERITAYPLPDLRKS